MGSRACREGSLAGCIWRLPVGSLGTAGTEDAGTAYSRGFLMRALVGDLSADVAQCGYFGIKNTVMFYGGRCPAGGGVEKVEKIKTNKQNSFVGRLLYMQENAQRE